MKTLLGILALLNLAVPIEKIANIVSNFVDFKSI